MRFYGVTMTGRKNRALQVPPVVPYKALGNFSKALYRTTGGTCGAQFSRPVMDGPLEAFELFELENESFH